MPLSGVRQDFVMRKKFVLPNFNFGDFNLFEEKLQMPKIIYFSGAGKYTSASEKS